MDVLFETQEQLLNGLSKKERYLLSEIDWSNRLIGIKGARGSGKTTLLFQHIKFKLSKEAEPLYASLDNLYFLDNTLLSLAKDFVLRGGTHLYLDEVHKYPNWSRELKLIYDQFPKLKTVFTSSSILEIYKGESDLSRRAVTYHLKELSFREYILFEKGIEIPKITLAELLNNHKQIAQNIKNKIPSPIRAFEDYLKHGAYPFYIENKKSYAFKKNLGGGVIHTCSHEINIMRDFFDEDKFESLKKIYKEGICSAYDAYFKSKNTIININIDFMSKEKLRFVKFSDKKKEYIFDFYKFDYKKINDYSYISSIKDFISCIKKRGLPKSNFKDALNTYKMLEKLNNE